MNILGVFIIYGWVFLCILLCLFLSRRKVKSRGGAENVESDTVPNFIYQICQVLSAAWLFLWLLIYLPASWPPHWLEKIQQRKIVFARVEQAGGWDHIKEDCNQLVQFNRTTGYQWFNHWYDTNYPLPKLPDSLAKLKPERVDLFSEADGMQSIRIQIFGMHSTGGRGIDFYTIKVVCPPPLDVKPPAKVDPNSEIRCGDRKIVDGVYEVTHHS